MSSICVSDIEGCYSLPVQSAKKLDRNDKGRADAQLTQGFTSGDEAGFGAFYKRFSTILLSVSYRVLGNRAEAEDSLQDAFVEMWKKSATFNPARGGLFTWAVMITRCRAIDKLRQRQRIFRATEAAFGESMVTNIRHEQAPDERVIQSDEQTRVKAALALISQHQREALELAFFGAMTQMQIAKALQVPLGTVKARIRRGLMALRRVMARDQNPVKFNSPRARSSARNNGMTLVPCLRAPFGGRRGSLVAVAR